MRSEYSTPFRPSRLRIQAKEKSLTGKQSAFLLRNRNLHLRLRSHRHSMPMHDRQTGHHGKRDPVFAEEHVFDERYFR